MDSGPETRVVSLWAKDPNDFIGAFFEILFWVGYSWVALAAGCYPYPVL